MIISIENTVIFQVNNDREDISDYSRELCWVFWNILLWTERRRYVIIPTENTVISQVNIYREDMCDYSR